MAVIFHSRPFQSVAVLKFFESKYDPKPYEIQEAINIIHATDNNLRSTKEGLFKNIEILNSNINAQDAWLRGRFQKEHEIIVNLLQDQHEQIGNRLQLQHWILFQTLGISDDQIDVYLQNAPFRRRLQVTNQTETNTTDLGRNFTEYESDLNVTGKDLESTIAINLPSPNETILGNQHEILQKIVGIPEAIGCSQISTSIDALNATAQDEQSKTRADIKEFVNASVVNLVENKAFGLEQIMGGVDAVNLQLVDSASELSAIKQNTSTSLSFLEDPTYGLEVIMNSLTNATDGLPILRRIVEHNEYGLQHVVGLLASLSDVPSDLLTGFTSVINLLRHNESGLFAIKTDMAAAEASTNIALQTIQGQLNVYNANLTETIVQNLLALNSSSAIDSQLVLVNIQGLNEYLVDIEGILRNSSVGLPAIQRDVLNAQYSTEGILDRIETNVTYSSERLPVIEALLGDTTSSLGPIQTAVDAANLAILGQSTEIKSDIVNQATEIKSHCTAEATKTNLTVGDEHVKTRNAIGTSQQLIENVITSAVSTISGQGNHTILEEHNQTRNVVEESGMNIRSSIFTSQASITSNISKEHADTRTAIEETRAALEATLNSSIRDEHRLTRDEIIKYNASISQEIEDSKTFTTDHIDSSHSATRSLLSAMEVAITNQINASISEEHNLTRSAIFDAQGCDLSSMIDTVSQSEDIVVGSMVNATDVICSDIAEAKNASIHIVTSKFRRVHFCGMHYFFDDLHSILFSLYTLPSRCSIGFVGNDKRE